MCPPSGLLLISCQKETEMVNAQKFGGEVTLEESVNLAEIYASPDQYKDKEIRVEGSIKEVCQHKGCWLKLTDGTKELTVRFKDYGFFIPKDAATPRSLLYPLRCYCRRSMHNPVSPLFSREGISVNPIMSSLHLVEICDKNPDSH
jgi:hypothetical protein